MRAPSRSGSVSWRVRLVVERGVVLRLAQLAEAAEIAEVHERTGRETYRGFVPAAYLDSVSVTH